MATYKWSGANGLWGALRYWMPVDGPVAVPGAGDTAVIQGGEVAIQGSQATATVRIG